MSNKNTPSIRTIVFTCLFAGLIIVGSQIAITLGFSPIPITMQTLFVLLAGYLLGPVWGAGAMGIFLIIGLVGFPVFSKGGSGLKAILGPTGGYLFGFLAAAWFTGFTSLKSKGNLILSFVGMFFASILIYMIGVPWLKLSTGMGWDKALAGGLYPFLIGDSIKLIMALILGKFLKPILDNFMLKDKYGYSKDSESTT